VTLLSASHGGRRAAGSTRSATGARAAPALAPALAVAAAVLGAPLGAGGEELAVGSAGPRALEVGVVVARDLASPPVVAGAAAERPAWRVVLREPGASYVCPRFARLDLPPGARLVVRSPDGTRQRTYRGGDAERARHGEGRWAVHVAGDTAILELWSDGAAVPAGAVRVDLVARGLAAAELAAAGAAGEGKALCGGDDARWARCYEQVEPEIYRRSRAVARLLVNGRAACTGFLVGSEGHLLTNAHCVDSEGDAANTNVELMAEGECDGGCAGYGACRGTLIANGTRLVRVNQALDYALLALPVDPTAEHGFLRLRAGGPTLGERIYIPQHPNFWGKRIAVSSTAAPDHGGVCRVTSLAERPCKGGPGDVGYMADTGGGSSGAPVMAYDDHAVVALHHCARCPNRGVPMDAIVADLGPLLPRDALASGLDAPPAASFTAATAGLAASFTDTSSDPEGALASWRWSFGDGGVASERHPLHHYAVAGAYEVTLTVTDEGGSAASASQAVVVAEPPRVLANGEPAAELWGGAGSERRFVVELPPGAVELTVATAGGAGDVDLYLRHEEPPALTDPACRPLLADGEEPCTVAAPAAGRWHVLLRGTGDYAGVSLTASWTFGAPPPDDGGGESDAAARCAGCLPHLGRLLRAGAGQWQPRPQRAYRAAAGEHRAALAVPPGADFDLELERRARGRWEVVAASSGPADDVTWSGPAGRYRWRVVSRSGGGRYTLWLRRP
jgi:PKD repeat protein